MKFSQMIRPSSLAAATCGMLILSSCHSDKKEVVDTDTIAIESAEPVDSVPSYLFTPEGIGSITPGMPIGQWPEETAGLYTHIDAEEGGDANQYNFYKDDELSFTVMDFGEGKADLIILDDPSMDVKIGEEKINMKTPFAKLLSTPGVKAEWEQLDDEGMWYWKANGLYFAPSLENLTPELSNKLYNPDKVPTKSDFPEEITIGYIGTGLPF